MFSFHEIINGVQCDVDFSDDLCLMYGDSATGKTFIASAINNYSKSRNKRCLFINGEDDIDRIVSDIRLYSNDKDAIIILDEADICYCREVVEALSKASGTRVVIFKTTLDYDTVNHRSLGYYVASWELNKVKIVRSKDGIRI